MASSDALPVPRKNVAFRVIFPLLDADGDLVTGAAGLDSEVSKDQAAFADCTNEATEIATSSGIYYLDLTSTEMNADCVAVIVKTSTVGAKTTPLVLYPQETGDIKVDVTSWLGTAASTPTVAGVPNVNAKTWNDLTTVALPLVPATAGRTLVVDAAGLADANVVKVGPTGTGTAQTAGDIMADTNDIQTRLPAALVGGRMDSSVGAMAANVLTATAINADAITAAKVADGTIDAATFAAGAINAAAIAADAITAAKIADGAIDAATFAAGAINAAAIAADAIGASELAADAVTEIQSGLATAASLATVAGYLDTEIADIKAKTDNLPASPAAVGSAMTLTSGERDSIAAALLDLANGVETSLTPRQALRIMLAAMAGKLSGAATTTVTIRNVGDSKARITATVDADGNRSAVTTDGT